MAENDTELFEDARILFRNFEGKEGQYNRKGDRNFCLILGDLKAKEMQKAGWNVKFLRAREEDEEPQPYIQVSVGYKVRPPRVVLISSKGRVDLTEAEVEFVDWVDISSVDLIIRPYHWNVNGKTGVKAYLQSMFIKIAEDYLEQKYSDVDYAVEGSAGMKAIESGQSPSEDDDIVEGEIVEEE